MISEHKRSLRKWAGYLLPNVIEDMAASASQLAHSLRESAHDLKPELSPSFLLGFNSPEPSRISKDLIMFWG